MNKYLAAVLLFFCASSSALADRICVSGTATGGGGSSSTTVCYTGYDNLTELAWALEGQGSNVLTGGGGSGTGVWVQVQESEINVLRREVRTTQVGCGDVQDIRQVIAGRILVKDPWMRLGTTVRVYFSDGQQTFSRASMTGSYQMVPTSNCG